MNRDVLKLSYNGLALSYPLDQGDPPTSENPLPTSDNLRLGIPARAAWVFPDGYLIRPNPPSSFSAPPFLPNLTISPSSSHQHRPPRARRHCCLLAGLTPYPR